jgi:hypothetical protein
VGEATAVNWVCSRTALMGGSCVGLN